MWICLLLSVVIAIDDYLDMEHVCHFGERFVSCQPQGNLALSAFDTLLRKAP
jgi:hypothetical protein